jgi:ribosomal protein S18 acetylase RimI-like enzyme
MEYVIRDATSADVAQITECVKVAFEPYVAILGKAPAPMFTDYSKAIEDGLVVVAISKEHTILGSIFFYEKDRCIWIDTVGVKPHLHGKGIGRALIAFVEKYAVSHGIYEIRLYTNVNMEKSIKLYNNLDYIEYDRRQEAGYDRVYYKKLLVQSSSRNQ